MDVNINAGRDSAPVAAQPNVSAISQLTLFKMSGDMKFMGIFYIIIGGLYCLTILGAVLGVPWLISGIRLRDSADSFKYYADSKDASYLRSAIDQQSRFFHIQKILLIVGLIIGMLAVAFGIIVALFISKNPYSYQS